MKFLEFLSYAFCLITPPFGWIILFFWMRTNKMIKNQQVFIEGNVSEEKNTKKISE